MIEATTEPLTFDWHAENKVDRNGLLVWLLPTMLAGARDATAERLSQATDGFRRCELSIQLNGVELPVRAFLDGVARNIEHAAAEEAAQLARVAGLGEINEAVTVARDAIRSTLYARLRAAGVPIEEEDGG